MSNQANYKTNMFLPYESNSRYESDYKGICIVSNGKTGSVPLNLLSSVHVFILTAVTIFSFLVINRKF